MFTVRVPATTANMGAGFDSIGMAFSLYNKVSVNVQESGLTIRSNQKDVPLDERNLIYQSILRFYKETDMIKTWNGISLIQQDDIPLTRGLGSSAACIVAGLVAANHIEGGKLSKHELAEIAAKMERHPDNSTPALLGGLVVGAMEGNALTYIKISTKKLAEDKLRFGVMIPHFHLSTEKARSVLPSSYSRSDVVFNASRTALFVAAMLSGDYKKLGIAMDDCVHQPYRKNLIPNYDDIFTYAKELGSYAVFLSGAGPTLIAIYQDEKTAQALQAYLKTLPHGWVLHELHPDDEGTVVQNII